MESISHYHRRLKAGETTVSEALAVFLERIELKRSLNALISWDAQAARDSARLLDQSSDPDFDAFPLWGVPVVVKDNIHVQGFANTAGTPGLMGFYPSEDHYAVKRLRAAGAIVLGKANMHELAMGITSINAFTGAAGNACDPDKIAGGSSGGSASAVAADLALASLGTDTGGSVRIPAALNGICGFRPSSGRYMQDNVTPISSTRDTVGPLAKTVTDLAIMDAVISGEGSLPDIPFAELRLGVPREWCFGGLEQGVERVVEDALSRLAEAGVTLIDIETPHWSEWLSRSSFPIVFNELQPLLERYLASFEIGISIDELLQKVASEDVKQAMAALQDSDTVDPGIYRDALEIRKILIESYHQLLQENRLDGLVFPTTPLVATDMADSEETVALHGKREPVFSTFIRHTDLSSLVGSPSVSMPCGTNEEGLPVGLEIDGHPGCDRRLLALAIAVQESLDLQQL